MIEQVNTLTVGSLVPDLTILLDLDAEVGIARAKQRQSGELDRIETESLEFFQAVREGYLKLAKAEADRFIVLDGLLPVDQIEEQVWQAIKAFI